MQLLNFRELFALHHLRVLKAFRGAAVVIQQRRVIFQNTALHLEIVDSPREGIGQRLENEDRKRLAIVVFAVHLVALASGLPEANLGMLIRMREDIGQKCQQARGPHVAQRGNHQDRKNFLRHNRLAHTGNQILDRDCAFPEEFLHQIVVAFRNHLHQLLVRFLGLVRQRCVAVGLIDVRLHRHQIDHAAKTLFCADRQLQRHYVAPKDRLQRFHRALEARKLAVHPGQHKRARNIVLRAVIPNFLRGDLRAHVGIDGDQCRIRRNQRSLRFRDERRISGQVDEINLYVGARAQRARPLCICQPGLNRDFPAYFFFIPIRGCASLRNFSPSRSHPRGVQQRRHQLRLASAAVAYNANVANVLGEIALHLKPPSKRGPSRRIRARARAWHVGTEGGERGLCAWVPVGRGRRSN